MRRFLIADDHSLVRRGIRQLLSEAFPSAVIEEVTNAEDLLEKALGEQWDVVISDISMPGHSGLETLQQVRLSRPDLPFLVLSVHSEDQYALRVLKAGASGYLNKESAPEQLIPAINQLLLGKKYITSSMAEKLATTANQNVAKMPHECLSDREFQVFKLLSVGISASGIAEELGLTTASVNTCRNRIMIKMDLKNSNDLALYAIGHTLI